MSAFNGGFTLPYPAVREWRSKAMVPVRFRRVAALGLFSVGYLAMAAFDGGAATAAEFAAFVTGSAMLVREPDPTADGH